MKEYKYLPKHPTDFGVESMVFLEDSKLDSFMPFQVSIHTPLEGGGSLMRQVTLFDDLESAEAFFNNLLV